jgi:Virulence factor BrkB
MGGPKNVATLNINKAGLQRWASWIADDVSGARTGSAQNVNHMVRTLNNIVNPSDARRLEDQARRNGRSQEERYRRRGGLYCVRSTAIKPCARQDGRAGEMAETLIPGRSLMRIYPVWLQGWVSLCKKAVDSWLDDRIPTMGAAIAYYTVFSLAPILVMVIAVAGLAFGRQTAEGALFGELADLVGPESAAAVQAMLRSASGTWSGIFCDGGRGSAP